MSPTDERHGTVNGHSQHRRDGEKPCRPCQEAANAASYARTYGDHDVPLTGGRWVLDKRTRVMRWHPDATTALDLPAGQEDDRAA